MKYIMSGFREKEFMLSMVCFLHESLQGLLHEFLTIIEEHIATCCLLEDLIIKK